MHNILRVSVHVITGQHKALDAVMEEQSNIMSCSRGVHDSFRTVIIATAAAHDVAAAGVAAVHHTAAAGCMVYQTLSCCCCCYTSFCYDALIAEAERDSHIVGIHCCCSCNP